MIAFNLSEKQKNIQQKIHALAESKLRPLVVPVDQEAPGSIDSRYLQILAREKLNALLIPGEYGGKELDCVTLAIVIEELTWGASDFSSIYQTNLHAIKAMLIAGSHEQKAEFLPQMMDPKKGIAAFCHTEFKGGSDSSSFTTTAHPEKGFYVLNGTKNPVINAGDACFFMVWANMENDGGRSGINAFLVPRECAGISYGPYYDKSGYRGVPMSRLILNNVRIPRKNLLGPMGSGYLTLMQAVDWGRVFVGASCVGIARAAIEIALDYAKKRIIKGRPIISNQGVAFTLAELSTRLEAARLLVWKACRLIDEGVDYTSAASMAKWFASELAVQAASDGLLILGQEGICRSALMDKLLRDAQLTRIVEGTSQIQKAIIASQL